MSLHIGQKLWWVNFATNKEGYVTVIGVYKDYFVVRYKGKAVVRYYDVIGKKLFYCQPSKSAYGNDWAEKYDDLKRKFGPFRPTKSIYTVQTYSHGKKETQSNHVPRSDQGYSNIPYQNNLTPVTRSCDNCALRKNGECTTLKNELCSSYKPLQIISQEEISNWPQYGDANAAGMGNKKRYKK